MNEAILMDAGYDTLASAMCHEQGVEIDAGDWEPSNAKFVVVNNDQYPDVLTDISSVRYSVDPQSPDLQIMNRQEWWFEGGTLWIKIPEGFDGWARFRTYSAGGGFTFTIEIGT